VEVVAKEQPQREGRLHEEPCPRLKSDVDRAPQTLRSPRGAKSDCSLIGFGGPAMDDTPRVRCQERADASGPLLQTFSTESQLIPQAC